MRAPFYNVLRVCKEVAYGVNTMSAIRHGQRPSPPPYLPPSLLDSVTVPAPDSVGTRQLVTRTTAPQPESEPGR
ncbi:hypothetical protein [Streptomyces oceani]|uniref:Uncharacterized protein n=1 Tax=Streptomyces oceani TaxID=1075402 RepID=A0A1E7JVQ9_9ACTN|nr:hypothetical protein [Streptomyces oceani]OEU94781.1 hypothetical protein AN216_24275 [Streptomyces oceani]